MLQPSADWYWFCESQQLMLSLGKTLQFQCAYNCGRLVSPPLEKQWFSMLDSERYMQLVEQLTDSQLGISGAELTQIALNGVAALAFHRPLALKSWYFSEQAYPGAIGQIASLENELNRGDVLILEHNSNVSTCMVVSKTLQLDVSKQLKQFELIKVMNNRLIPYIPQSLVFSRSA